VACTGLHGANRLASNSLLEAVVFAHRAVEHSLRTLTGESLREQGRGARGAAAGLRAGSERARDAAQSGRGRVPAWDAGKATPQEDRIDIAATWLEIRTLMWNYVGIVRTDRRLERASRRLEILKAEVNAYYWDHLLTQDLIELRNLLTVAELIVTSARLRKESRGLHFTTDYPTPDDTNFLHDTVLC
jgi:L-aspartate oxidase